MLAGGQQLPDLIVQEGWARLRDDAERKAESPPAAELLEKLQALEAHAKADEKGVWNASLKSIQNVRELSDPKAFVEEHKGEAIETVVERVLSGDRLICRLMVTPTQHVSTTVLIGVFEHLRRRERIHRMVRRRPAEPYGNESQAFVRRGYYNVESRSGFSASRQTIYLSVKCGIQLVILQSSCFKKAWQDVLIITQRGLGQRWPSYGRPKGRQRSGS